MYCFPNCLNSVNSWFLLITNSSSGETYFKIDSKMQKYFKNKNYKEKQKEVKNGRETKISLFLMSDFKNFLTSY